MNLGRLHITKRNWNVFLFVNFFSVHSDLHQMTAFSCGFVHCSVFDRSQRSTMLLVACISRRMFCIVLLTNESQKKTSFWAAPCSLFIALGSGAVSLGALPCLSLHREVPAVGFLCCTALLPSAKRMGGFTHGASVHSWARHLPFLSRERTKHG